MNRVLFGAGRRLAGMVSAVFTLTLWHSSISTARGAEFFVAPNGSPAGDGSVAAPWDLQTAFHHPPSVAPGDLIWMRGGIYRKNNQLTQFISHLSGAAEQPITVRQYPGERAIIDGNIVHQTGGWVRYWGFEVMNTHSNRVSTESGSFPTTFRLDINGQTVDWAASGFDLRAPNVKLINLVVHDSIGGGISISTSATNPEVYGTLSFYNGWQGCDRGHGHGLYIQSRDPSGALISDNLFFANYALGIQATGNGDVVDNIHFEGNAAFSNSVLARRRQGNFLVGPLIGRAKNPVLLNNFIYDVSGSSSDSNIGYAGGSTNAIVAGNYFQTSVHFSEHTEGLTLVSNTFLSSTPFLERSNYPNNVFIAEVPAFNVVEIRTNKYEPGRATVIIYNWENREVVPVNVAGFLSIGTPFEVRTAQNYRGAPIISAVFDSEVLALPMGLLPVSKPVGTSAPASTAPIFRVFIIQIAEESPDPNFANEAPTISSISDLITYEDLETASVPLVFQDVETPAEYLNLSVLSSNPKLVPHKNIRIEGTGTNRVLSLIPALGQTGTALITLAVSDGLESAETTFNLQVLPRIDPPTEGETNPVQLSISLVEATPTIRIDGVLDVDYDVQASEDLLEWQFVGTISTDCHGSGSFHEHGVENGHGRFYRVLQSDEH